MITLLFLSLINPSHANPETDDNSKIVFIDFEEASVDGVLVGPRLTLVTLKPNAKPDMLIPDVRQLFIDKHPVRVTDIK